MKQMIVLFFSMILIGSMSSTAQADIIAGWDMYGVGTVDTVTGVSDLIEVTVYDMSMGDGLSAYSGSNSFNTSGWGGTDAGDYIQIGFSVADGFEVTLDEFWLGTRSSSTGPGTIGVYTSLDNYTTAIYSITQDDTAYINSIFDLSILGMVSGDFYIRLYEIGDTQADGDGSTSASGTFRITDYYDSGEYTDVQITGTVSAVPIPAALWLLGSGLIAVFGVSRKKV